MNFGCIVGVGYTLYVKCSRQYTCSTAKFSQKAFKKGKTKSQRLNKKHISTMLHILVFFLFNSENRPFQWAHCNSK